MPSCADSVTSTAIDYFESINNGSILSCKKIKKLSERMLPRLKGEVIDEGYHYDKEKAFKVVYFIENFCYTPSGNINVLMKLEPFQIAFICCVFGFVDDYGYRKHKEAILVMGRKNGKTSLCAALELYMLIADGEGSPQIYNVATKKEQAELGFKAAQKMVQMSDKIKKKVRKKSEKNTDILDCSFNFGYIKPLSSRTDGLDGLDIHSAIVDELAAIKNRDLYDLMKQGTGSRNQPIIFEITTNGFERNGIFDAQYDYAKRWLDGEFKDESFIAFIYELDKREEWSDKSCWIKANPGLGVIKKMTYMNDSVNKAKNDSSYLPTVLVKDFNIPENSAVAWLTFSQAVNNTIYYSDTNSFKGMGFRYGIFGYDASETTDLTCAQLIMMKPDDEKIYEKSMYWLPEDAIEYDIQSGNRRERDDVPYQQWVSRGLLRTCEGNIVDKRVILDWIIEIRDEFDVYPFALGYDPWHLTDDAMRTAFESAVGKSRAVSLRQGPQTLSQPMKQIVAEYSAKRFVDNNNPINQWCRMNVQILTDVNNNIRPVKKLTNPKNRIDGFMAELFAYTVFDRMKDEYLSII